tara:strand:- start:220 stop:672 length:453 start_codon:yes stop_codon:yes gene_type:complete
MEVQGFPNYLIYPDGRVQNKNTGRILKQHISSKGYYTVKLYNNGYSKDLKIHRLVGIHYIPNPNNYPQIDHIDRNRQNNNSDNLRWVTNSQNCLNKGKMKTNTSGITNIMYHKINKYWRFEKVINGRRFEINSKSKPLVLWVKFVFELTH